MLITGFVLLQISGGLLIGTGGIFGFFISLLFAIAGILCIRSAYEEAL